jgi:hypothetical protein
MVAIDGFHCGVDESAASEVVAVEPLLERIEACEEASLRSPCASFDDSRKWI